MSTIEELAERVDRLLLRHEELQRTSSLLQEQLVAVTQERDSLRSRLNAARQRVDVLLERLPKEPSAQAAGAQPSGDRTTATPRQDLAAGTVEAVDGTLRAGLGRSAP